MFNVEEVKKFKIADDGLLDKLKEILKGKGELEGVYFEFNGIDYGFNEVKQDDEIDEGKYVSGRYHYQLASLNKEKATYLCRESQLDEYNVIVEVGYAKSGSYWGGYEWYYDKPVIKIVVVKLVPEVVIPEHEEVFYQ